MHCKLENLLHLLLGRLESPCVPCEARCVKPKAQIDHQRHRRSERGEMKKTSALTAALSGRHSESVPSVSEDAAKHSESFSFPCLDRNNKQTANGLDDITQELSRSSLKSHSIAGSAPTAVVLPNGSIAVSLSHTRGGYLLPLLHKQQNPCTLRFRLTTS